MTNLEVNFFYHGSTSRSGPGHPHFRGFTITFRYTTLGRTSLDQWPAQHKDLCVITHNIRKKQTFMPPAGIRTWNPSKQVTADPRLRPRGHWHRPSKLMLGLLTGADNRTSYILTIAIPMWCVDSFMRQQQKHQTHHRSYIIVCVYVCVSVYVSMRVRMCVCVCMW